MSDLHKTACAIPNPGQSPKNGDKTRCSAPSPRQSRERHHKTACALPKPASIAQTPTQNRMLCTNPAPSARNRTATVRERPAATNAQIFFTQGSQASTTQRADLLAKTQKTPAPNRLKHPRGSQEVPRTNAPLHLAAPLFRTFAPSENHSASSAASDANHSRIINRSLRKIGPRKSPIKNLCNAV
jgi:hypothetical protein